MTIRALQSCSCSHIGAHHRLDGTCVLCPCERYTRARAPMPVTLAIPQGRPLQKPKRGPLLDRDGQ